MAIRKIITYPDPILRQPARKVNEFGAHLEKLVQDMAETMYAAPGIGLAANQIGVSEQVILVDLGSREEEKKYIALINPEISRGEGSLLDEEGCLSVLDYTAKVKRYQKIWVRAQSLTGEVVEFPAEDRYARILQHEVDHLLGKLFIDHLSSLKRNLYKRKLSKMLRDE